jgi:type II secretory ATPase GspE/PulE/Tfp pilus assembly ATPase PilB-like protein
VFNHRIPAQHLLLITGPTGSGNDEAGFSFATGLRSILRQDPDVIMVWTRLP